MQEFMYYFASTRKTIDEACESLERSIKNHGYGVLHSYDFKKIFEEKSVDFDNECRVFEVCNPSQAKRLMNNDMKLNMALPCRISVYTENGEVKVGMVSPLKMLSVLSRNEMALKVARQVDATLRQVIDEAK